MRSPEFSSKLKNYVRCRSTSKLENFNSHTLLSYVPKRLSFSYDSYTTRCMLAVLDYNNHHDRAVDVNRAGEETACMQRSRRTKQWVAYKRLSQKNYSYIPGITKHTYKFLGWFFSGSL